jgi:hypothetical protein
VRPRLPTTAVLKELIHEQRRAILKARTISVTLQSALVDFEQVRDSELSFTARRDLRRSWCEHAAEMIQDLRAETLRTRAMGRHISELLRGDALERAVRELNAASDDAEHAIDVADEVARRSLQLPA